MTVLEAQELTQKPAPDADQASTPMQGQATQLCALGLGCDRGTPAATLEQAIEQALLQAGLQWHQVAAVASIDLKADEICMQEISRQHHWRMRFFPAQRLAGVAVPNPSETVRKYTGTPSVSEAAALLVGGLLLGHAQALPARQLLVEKHKLRGQDGRNATVSVAILPAHALPTHALPDVHRTTGQLAP